MENVVTDFIPLVVEHFGVWIPKLFMVLLIVPLLIASGVLPRLARKNNPQRVCDNVKVILQ